VIIIEHNLDVIRNADWILDLGPDGGEEGGRIVAQGTPEQVARVKKSYTGQGLAQYFNGASNGGGNGAGTRAPRGAELSADPNSSFGAIQQVSKAKQESA
jgi:excinuclease ABC subunit A